MSDLPSNRESFGSKFGIIAATAGSAVGLGNIWRYPYVVGENGGAAFILKRGSATWLATFSVSILGVFCVLSTSSMTDFKILGKTVFELLEYTTANVLLPMGGFFIVIFVAWFFGRNKAKEELSNNGDLKARYIPLYLFIIKFVAPLAIAFVFLQGIGLINLK